MKPIVEDINSVQRRIKVTVPPEDVNKAFSAYYQRVRGKAKVHGFRQGKVPMTLIKKMYSGSGSYDIVDQLIRDHLLSSIRESGLRAISNPYVENSAIPTENQAYEIVAIVDILPEIKLEGLHKKLEVSFEFLEADDHMLGHRLDHLARQHARVKPVEPDTSCEQGHLIKISFIGKIDGVVDPQLSVDDQVVEVGRHQLFFPEIDAAVIGMKVGETKSVEASFKGRNVAEAFKDKAVTFDVTLRSIQKLEIPEIDEEFAKDLNYESVQDLKEKVRAGLQSYYDRMKQDNMHNALLKQLTEKVDFEVPPSITDQVIDHIISQNRFPNEQQLKKALADKSIRADVLPEAKMRAKNTMILHELIREEKIEVSDEELREAVQAMHPQIQGSELDKKLIEHGSSEREQLLFKKALAFLVSHAKLHPVLAAHDHDHHEEHDHDDHDHDHDDHDHHHSHT